MTELVNSMILSAAAAEDLRKKSVDGRLLFLYALLGTVSSAACGRSAWDAAAALCPGLILLGVSFVSRGGMGEGDALCFAALGFTADLYGVLEIMMISFMAAGVYAAGLCVLMRIRYRKGVSGEKFALIPFILAAYVLRLAAQRI